MKKHFLLTVAVFVFAPVATAVIAQNGAGGMVQHAVTTMHSKFIAADQDKDGFLTKDEAMQGKMPGVAKHFDEVDLTHRGKVSESEIHDYFKKAAQARAAKRTS